MAYKYPHFIPQNTAPSGAKRIVAYNGNGERVCMIPLGGLTPPSSSKVYSFGLVSDTHITLSNTRNRDDFNRALTIFEERGCLFCCNAGDITNVGFRAEGDKETLFTDQFAEYKRICNLHPSLPVYEICGNHESYVIAITENLSELEEYTGQGEIVYTVTHGNDVFIFVGQSTAGLPMSYDHMQWLYDALEANRNKRCFVFVHSFMNDDSGNPLSARNNSLFANFTATRLSVFKRMMSHYQNALLLHGHSHMKLESQEFDKCANYTEKNGFKSIHIPSSAMPRTLFADGTWEDDSQKENESQGYIVDVYEDCIVLNGINFINGQCIPMGTYKINTPIIEIEAGTFSDNSGVLQT